MLRRVWQLWAASLVLSLGAGAGLAEGCRQALALGLDVSGSVDGREYRLQKDGLAAALEDPAVKAALLGSPGFDVDLMVYEWSSWRYQRVVVPWTRISGVGQLSQVTAALRATKRRGTARSTGLGSAMLFGARALAEREDCAVRTLDISGDGKNNDGVPPGVMRRKIGDVTVNALVIGADSPHGGDQRQVEIGELAAYFEANVILGPEAFVEVALGYEDYARAMQRKLLREIKTLVIGELAQ